MPGNGGEQHRFVPAYNPPEGCFLAQRPRQDNCALNAANRLFREWLGLRRRNVAGFETMRQRRYPTGKIVPDPACEGVPGGTQTDPADETHSPARSEIGSHVLDHGPDRRCRIAGLFERCKDRRAEPAVYVGENRIDHLLLPAGKEVVEAAFAQAGRLRKNRQARPLEAVFAERLCQCRYGTAPIGEGTLRVQRSRSLSEG